MRIYNADGGEVESCGNAARCVAHLLMNENNSREIRLETDGGPLACMARGDLVSVDVGAPRFGWRDIPMSRETDTKAFALDVPGFDLPALKSASAVSVGNPHCVLFVDDAERASVSALGPIIENHSLFPARTNVEFVSVLGKDKLRMRVWERGVGITLACGTAFPYPHAQLVFAEHAHEFDIGARRKQRMIFDSWSQCRNRRAFRIVHEQHAMRIADRNSARGFQRRQFEAWNIERKGFCVRL